MSNLQELADRLAIRELIERYSSALTRRAWDEMGATYHPDAQWRVGEPDNLFFETRQSIRDGISSIVTQSDFLVQMTHSIVIDLHGERATAVTVVNEIGRVKSANFSMFLLGTYNDEITRVDGRWGFYRRYFQPYYRDLSPLEGDVYCSGQAVDKRSPVAR
jgi:hypothetical protein